MKLSKTTIIIYAVTAILLSIPFFVMQFTTEVDWSIFDFIVAGILLFTTAFVIDFILKKVKTDSKRFVYIGIALIILFLIWAELAVGIFGTPFAGN